MQATNPAGGSLAIGVRLSIMMFLQFFVWGAWFVTLGPFMGTMGFRPEQIGNAYSTAPIAAILSPFFLGIVADRFFPSEKVMGVLHALGGVLLFLAPSLAAKGAENGGAFVGILLAHMLCYMPTLGLSNTVAFHAMTNPEKQFPMVRVWGTIGWIVAGVSVGLLARQLVTSAGTFPTLEAARSAAPNFFYVAGGAGVLLGVFSFFLPTTPAPSKGKPFSVGAIIGIDSLRLLKQRSFAVFMLSSMLICIPLAAYYSFAASYAVSAGVENVPIKMTFGQMSEIFFMLVMPLFFARLGVKWMLAVGMLAWVVRYGFFAGAWDSAGGQHAILMILGGIILHGICYDFFFVTGQIYTEQSAPKEVRAQAQGFLVLVTQGVGMLIGAQVFSKLVAHYTTKAADGTSSVAWQQVWMWPAAFALGVLVLFVLLFNDRKGVKAPA
jgi:nucleoside transporter